MKKYIPYIVVGVILIAVAIWFFSRKEAGPSVADKAKPKYDNPNQVIDSKKQFPTGALRGKQ